MTSMVERVARALAQRYIDRCNARITGSDYQRVQDMPESYMKDFREDARAAIAAMREPSESMKSISLPLHNGMAAKGMASHFWPRMIDAALEETK